MGCVIAWTAFSWEAAAGFAAVAAAVAVALKQINISKRQIELSDDANRVALFELRFQVYAATQRYLWNIENVGIKGEVFHTDWARTFYEAQKQAKFLFGQGLKDELDKIHSKCVAYRVKHRTMKENISDYGKKESGEDVAVNELGAWISWRIETLDELFPELDVSGKP